MPNNQTARLGIIAAAVTIVGTVASWGALHAGYGAIAVSVGMATGYFVGGAVKMIDQSAAQ